MWLMAIHEPKHGGAWEFEGIGLFGSRGGAVDPFILKSIEYATFGQQSQSVGYGRPTVTAAYACVARQKQKLPQSAAIRNSPKLHWQKQVIRTTLKNSRPNRMSPMTSGPACLQTVYSLRPSTDAPSGT